VTETEAPAVTFVDFLPSRTSPTTERIDLASLVAQLSTRPGIWAEVERSDRRTVVASRGAYITGRSAYRDRVEAAVRKIDDEYVLFARALPGAA
jgi:hypothetical protein